MDKGKKIYFVSLGCPKNLVDSEVMLGLAQEEGYEMVIEAEEADLLVINTCSFIEDARKESIDGILELAELKEAYPSKKLIVTGCLPQRYPEELAKELHEVDHFIGTSDIPRFRDLLRGEATARTFVSSEPSSWLYSHLSPRILSTPFYTAYVKIAEGCDRHCAFCAIPTFRGNQLSRPMDSIIEEVKLLAQQGVVEINLIAQELNGYGRDLADGTNLLKLLEALEKNDQTPPWIRLLYLYPHDISDELIDFIARSNKILPYIDMPIQHVNPKILKRMGRGQTAKEIRTLIPKLRDKIPNLTLRTTLLVGFPGETEEDFEELYHFIEEEPFDHLGVFAYSKEEGTRAYDLSDEIPFEIAQQRQKLLYDLQAEISAQRLQRLIDRDIEVLVEGISDESEFLLQGRSKSQAPDIDGVTYINDGQAQAGEIVTIRIEQVGEHDLVGGIIDS